MINQIKPCFPLKKCFFLFLIFSLNTPLLGQKITCILKGEVIDRDSEALVLFKATADSRGEKITIPIENRVFEYTFESDAKEAFTLAFKEEADRGAYMPIHFFAEDGEVLFQLHPSENVVMNEISGGKVNNEMMAFNRANFDLFWDRQKVLRDQHSALQKEGRLFSEAMQELSKELQNTTDRLAKNELYKKMSELRENKKDLSPEGKVIMDKLQAIGEEYGAWKNKYIDENPSLYSFFLIFQDARSLAWNKNLSIVDLRKRYDKLAKAFPEHPYTPFVGKMIAGHAAVKVGEDLIDFSAPNLDGKSFQFSSLATGKVTLLDLWASWCGPCIVKSRTMVPVYEAYKDKGFTVVGVAREFKNTDRLLIALEREKFPWLNLIDLDDQQEIWLKYNIPYSGGGTFLIDEKGKILEIDPTPESIQKVMEERN